MNFVYKKEAEILGLFILVLGSWFVFDRCTAMVLSDSLVDLFIGVAGLITLLVFWVVGVLQKVRKYMERTSSKSD